MKKPIAVNAARLSIIAIVTYQVILILLIFLRPDIDPSWHTISEWAYGPWGWLMSAGFMVSGLSYAALFVLIKPHTKGFLGYAGLVLLAICTIGAIGVGIFTTDPMTTKPEDLSTIGMLHMIFGGSQLALFPFAVLFISLGLALKNADFAPAKRTLFWIAGLPLFGFICFISYHGIFVAPLGPYAYGPGVHIGWPPRFAFFCYMLWVVIFCAQALKLHKTKSA
nr:DUF998 domain-containing protein [uncultured Mucilaginibacter sp.]